LKHLINNPETLKKSDVFTSNPFKKYCRQIIVEELNLAISYFWTSWN